MYWKKPTERRAGFFGRDVYQRKMKALTPFVKNGEKPIRSIYGKKGIAPGTGKSLVSERGKSKRNAKRKRLSVFVGAKAKKVRQGKVPL